ncbi:MAG: hypothetical protein DCC68_20485 [Planctomycetota bacterium]|nr:MAG: hypothetical protein DCC68_20485 [Planctomycetota bacterium]
MLPTFIDHVFGYVAVSSVHDPSSASGAWMRAVSPAGAYGITRIQFVGVPFAASNRRCPVVEAPEKSPFIITIVSPACQEREFSHLNGVVGDSPFPDEPTVGSTYHTDSFDCGVALLKVVCTK